MRRLFGLFAIVYCAACTDSPVTATHVNPPIVTSVDVSGTWRGTSTSNIVSGTGQLTLTIAQSGASLSGTWASSWANPLNNNAGSLSGSVSGANFSASLTSGNPQLCSSTATAVLANGQISGTYAGVNCVVANGGSFTLTRQ